MRQEQLHHLGVTLPGSPIERGETIFFFGIDVRAGSQQDCRHLEAVLSTMGRIVQRGFPIFVWGVHQVGVGLEQLFDLLDLALLDREMELDFGRKV